MVMVDLAGVINIVTKRGKKDVIHGMVLGEAGDRSHYLGQFNLSGGYGKANFFLSGSHSERDGFRVSQDFKKLTPLEDGGTRAIVTITEITFLPMLIMPPTTRYLSGLSLVI